MNINRKLKLAIIIIISLITAVISFIAVYIAGVFFILWLITVHSTTYSYIDSLNERSKTFIVDNNECSLGYPYNYLEAHAIHPVDSNDGLMAVLNIDGKQSKDRYYIKKIDFSLTGEDKTYKPVFYRIDIDDNDIHTEAELYEITRRNDWNNLQIIVDNSIINSKNVKLHAVIDIVNKRNGQKSKIEINEILTLTSEDYDDL
ncbi:MAG: hypothetical protein KAZ87_11770 [Spirochaetes bacterium]|nr:hypothetical protein [Spirochaetota bacterium]